MGLLEVGMEVANPKELHRRVPIRLLVDTGASYSMIPKNVLEKIGVFPIQAEEVEVADGRKIHRDIGEVTFFWQGKGRTSQVIFGEEGDTSLLGVLALESLALQVDSRNQQLKPAKLVLY